MSKSYLEQDNSIFDIFEITGKDTIDLLTRNAVKCLVCGEVLESKHRHHYTQCKCPNQAACDGGLDYQRVLAVDLDKVENLAEYHTYTKEEYYELKRKQKERENKAFYEVLKELLDD